MNLTKALESVTAAFAKSVAAMRARRFASACTRLGEAVTLDGEPDVANEGELTIGARVHIEARAVPTRLRVGPGGSLGIGDDTRIAFGAIIVASREVQIGSRVRIGPYASIVDGNFGDPDFESDRSPAVPIHIGDDAELGSRVTILKGSRIGAGARITAGSVVMGEVPPFAIATGNPAQIVGTCRATLVHEALHATAARRPGHPALIWGGEQISYQALWGRIAAIVQAIPATAAAGEAALVFTSSKIDYLAALYACLARGVVGVPVPEAAARATLIDLRDGSRARLLLADPAALAQFDPPLAQSDGLTIVDVKEAARAFKPTLSRAGLARDLDPSSPALVLFTSGTTARKKAVVLSHRALLQATTNINEFMGIDQDVREYVSIPLGHSFGLGRVRAVFAVGGTLVLGEGLFSPAAMVKAIESRQCNALSAVPATLAMFQGRLEAALRRAGEQIRTVELGSAFMSPDAKRRLLEVFPHARLCMHYGLTEASRSAFIEFRREAHKLETVGRAAPNTALRIVRADGSEAAAGEEGEIVIAGAHLTSGYLGDPELTRRALDPSGAFHTGDHGFLDAEGYLHLLGRKDEMINTGGVKISPLELEAKIRESRPSVELCVVGIPDPAGLAGEVPIVAYTGTPSPPLTLVALASELAQRVEKNKLPHDVVRVERIPRTDNGKPIRRELRALVLAALAARPQGREHR